MNTYYNLRNSSSTSQNAPPINLSEMSSFEIDRKFPYSQAESNKEKFKSISQDDLERALSQNKLDARYVTYLSDDHIRNLKLSSLPPEAVQLLCNIKYSMYMTLEEKQRRFALLAPAEIEKALQEEKLDLKSYFALLLPEAFQRVRLLKFNEAEMKAFDESLGTTRNDRSKRLWLLLNSDLFLEALIQGNIPNSICTLLPVEFFNRIPLSLLSKAQIEALFPPEKMLTHERNALAMVSAEEIQKAIEKDLLAPAHYNALSLNQVSQLQPSRFQREQVDKLCYLTTEPDQRKRFAVISPDEVNLMIEKDLLNEKYRSLISPEQLFSIKLSHLSQVQIDRLFPTYDNFLVLKERWSYLDPSEINKALAENRIPIDCLSLFTEETYKEIKISALSTEQISKLFPNESFLSQERFSRLPLSEVEACIQKKTLPYYCYKFIPDEKLPLLNLSLFQSHTTDSIYLLLDSKPSRVALLNPLGVKSLIRQNLFPTNYYDSLSIEQVPYDQIPLMPIREFTRYFPIDDTSPHLKERFGAIPPHLLEEAIKHNLLEICHFNFLSDNQLRHLDISLLTKEQLFYIFPLEGNLFTNLKEKQRRFQLIPHNYVMQFVEKDLERRFPFITHPLREDRELQLFLALCSQRARDQIRTTLQCRALSRNGSNHGHETFLDQNLR